MSLPRPFSCSKRLLSNARHMSRNISPPPLKRRRKQHSQDIAPTLTSRPITPLQDNQIRIFTWNINGIQPFLQRSIRSYFKSSKDSTSSATAIRTKAANLRQCLQRWGWPQVVCLQEIKIAPGDTKTQESVRAAVKALPDSLEPTYNAYFSLPRDKFNARGFGGQIYGVCMLVRSDQSLQRQQPSNAVAADWDLEGRVLVLRLNRPKLLIINIYAVNGTENPYKSPITGDVVGTRHTHKPAFHTRMRDMVATHEREGWKVVIAGDLNIARSPLDGFPGIRHGPAHLENRRDFEAKFMEPRSEGGLEMVDSFRHLHGEERKYTYRSPAVPWGASCDRVDLILLSSYVIQESGMLLEADILDEERERASSDHAPSYVTLDLGVDGN
ncbi:hypothetical protein S7711_10830 [Stachybotrys chartarum IBT 7711]|uniref:Endonuclease/exonuclease/phosphatase domain-containing protein n=1 Tax=Stachybotrys chartarum (strain CBS 109288 / IBT 7711) TaxID=1280523 RepID=A0A084B5H3_STACB|nr:hypothetical protein S7711_10830 [Stachybotrys chartarum IBT 7711]